MSTDEEEAEKKIQADIARQAQEDYELEDFIDERESETVMGGTSHRSRVDSEDDADEDPTAAATLGSDPKVDPNGQIWNNFDTLLDALKEIDPDFVVDTDNSNGHSKMVRNNQGPVFTIHRTPPFTGIKAKVPAPPVQIRVVIHNLAAVKPEVAKEIAKQMPGTIKVRCRFDEEKIKAIIEKFGADKIKFDYSDPRLAPHKAAIEAMKNEAGATPTTPHRKNF